MYDSRISKGEKFCIVTKDDYYRKRFDTLVKGGIAIKYSEFTKDLLSALNLSRLREIGRAAGLKSLRSDKIGSCKMLRELPNDVLKKAWSVAEIDIDTIYELRTLQDIWTEILAEQKTSAEEKNQAKTGK